MPQLSTKEALDHFKDLELSESEMDEAILWAKQKKFKRLEYEEKERIANENRKKLTSSKWSYDQTHAFMRYRANDIFEGKFVLDKRNQFLFDLLCYYFSEDSNFVSIAINAGIKSPSLEKGVMLAGNFGVGKTWLMKLFCKNQRQTFYLRNAKQIADEYQADGVEASLQYEGLFKNAVNDSSVFFQPFSGLCIDDIGSEDVKKHFGNNRNVIGDLIELRYAKGNVGKMLHGTTNLTAQQLLDYYGGRVVSRMREIFNFIEVDTEDRRK